MDFNIPEDLKMVQTLARDFVKEQLIPLEREVLGREVDMQGVRLYLPPQKEAELSALAREIGLWGVGLPEDLGGIGLGVLGTCLVEEELAKTVLPFNLGDVTPILFDCNEDQKRDYLLPLVSGAKTCLLAIVEPGQEADPLDMQMKASRQNGAYLLSGAKVAFGRSSRFDYAIVFAVTDPAQGVRQGISCFLVDAGTPGFTVRATSEPEGWRAQVPESSTLVFENCLVPVSKILGQVGQAFRLGAKWLPSRRIIRSARSVGAATRLLDASIEHARSWQVQGQVVIENPENRDLLAEMFTEIEAARLMMYYAAGKADAGQDIRREAAMVKVFASQMLEHVAARAALIKGGPGSARELPLQVLCRSFELNSLAERSLTVQKSIIASEILKLGTIL
jgi:acyl-CoA dehydrogenase